MKRGKKTDFIMVIALSILIICLGNTEKGKRVGLYLNSIALPFQAYTSFFFNTFKTRRENKILREKIAELTLKNQFLNTYKFENERLNTLLDFKDQVDYELIPASIIKKPSNLFVGTFSIDKGKLAGVEKDLPVITENGIYGKIIELTPQSSLVQTMFNFNFRVGGMSQRNGVQGLVRWDAQRGCIFEQVPLYSDIKTGDQIVTSGLGSVFPKGLAIGEVKKIALDETKLYYSISLKPASDFSRASNVFVMKEAPKLIAQDDSLFLQGTIWKLYRIQQDTIETLSPPVSRHYTPRFPVKFEPPEPTIRTD